MYMGILVHDSIMIKILSHEHMGTCFFIGRECVTHVKLRRISAILSYFR